MKNTIYTAAAITAALLVVLSQRFIIPALILAFKAIEESYAPNDDQLVLELTPEQEIADLQVILDDEDAERATALASDDASVTSAKAETKIEEKNEPSTVTAPKRATRRRRKTNPKPATANA